MTSGKQKLYAYVDESGQDTEGRMFVVGVVILSGERERIAKELERIETQSGKGVKKWHKAARACRIMYFENVVRTVALRETLFFETFTDTKKYIEMTSFATAKAILKRATSDEYAATIFIDGFRKREIEMFVQGLHDLRIKRRKVRGVRKEESNSLIRLADALCGLVRDTQADDEWAVATLRRLKKEGMVIAL